MDWRILKWRKVIFQSLIPKSAGEMDRLPDVLGYRTTSEGEAQYLHIGPKRHANLSDGQIARIARLREVLAEVYPMSLEGWIDGFLRDLHPEQEIGFIEAAAATYRSLTAKSNLSRDEKGKLYAALCLAISEDGPFQIEPELYDRLSVDGDQDLVRLVRVAVHNKVRP